MTLKLILCSLLLVQFQPTFASPFCNEIDGLKEIQLEEKNKNEVDMSRFRVVRDKNAYKDLLNEISLDSLKNILELKPTETSESGADVILNWLKSVGLVRKNSSEYLQYLLVKSNKSISELDESSGLVTKQLISEYEQSALGRIRKAYKGILNGNNIELRRNDTHVWYISSSIKRTLETAIRSINGSDKKYTGSLNDFNPISNPKEFLLELTLKQVEKFISENKSNQSVENTSKNTLNTLLMIAESFRIDKQQLIIDEPMYRLFLDSIFKNVEIRKDGIITIKQYIQAKTNLAVLKVTGKTGLKLFNHKASNEAKKNLLKKSISTFEEKLPKIPYYTRIKTELKSLMIWLEKRLDPIRLSQQGFPEKSFPPEYTTVPKTKRLTFKNADLLALEKTSLNFSNKYLHKDPYTNEFLKEYKESYYESNNIESLTEIPGKKTQRDGIYGKMDSETYKIYLRVANLFAILQGTPRAHKQFIEAQDIIPGKKTTYETFTELHNVFKQTALELGYKAGYTNSAHALVKGAEILTTLITMDVVGRGSSEYLDQITKLYDIKENLSGVDFDRRYVKILNEFPFALPSYLRQNNNIRKYLEDNANYSFHVNLGTLNLMEAGYGSIKALRNLSKNETEADNQLSINLYFIRGLLNISGVNLAPIVKPGSTLMMDAKLNDLLNFNKTLSLIKNERSNTKIYDELLNQVCISRGWPLVNSPKSKLIARLATVLDYKSIQQYSLLEKVFEFNLTEKEQNGLLSLNEHPITLWRAQYLKNAISKKSLMKTENERLINEAKERGELDFKPEKPTEGAKALDEIFTLNIWLKMLSSASEAAINTEAFNRMSQNKDTNDIRLDFGELINYIEKTDTSYGLDTHIGTLEVTPVPQIKSTSFDFKNTGVQITRVIIPPEVLIEINRESNIDKLIQHFKGIITE